ncbi:hypothetical protein MMC25_000052 [Agyrium rufum]|nr:hypothetical protein [Agyrium rufum]
MLEHFYNFHRRRGQGGPDLYEDYCRILEEGNDPNEDWRNESRSSPLFSAVLDHDLQQVELFLRHGAQIEKHNRRGLTALQQAVLLSHEDTVQKFLDQGTDLEAPVESEYLFGGTVLHLAASEGSTTIVEMLLRYGANPYSKSAVGWKPLDTAILDRQETLVDILWHSMPTAIANPSPESNHAVETVNDGKTLANHLIENGVKDTTPAHLKLYLGCLEQSPHANDGASINSRLICEEVEDILLAIAGLSKTLTWQRKHCLHCQRFQEQSSHTLFAIFDHAPDFAALKQSAEDGCGICQLLVHAVEDRWCLLRQVSGEWIQRFGIAPEVRLLLQHKTGPRPDLYGYHRLIVVCGEKIAFIDLNHVQKHLNSAVSETPPLDIESSGSERSLAVSKAWFQRCLEEHPTCCRDDGLGDLPSRVIDVGDDSHKPFVYCSENERLPYAALSYCWGSTTSVRSLTSNIAEHQRSLSLEDLPKTMADAIIITRKFGIRYLWIDALCILQDSKEDFNHEVDNMRSIYAHATFTIAATDAASCYDGCFKERKWASTVMTPLDIRLPGGLHEKRSGIHCRMKNTHTSVLNRIMAMSRHRFDKQKEGPVLNSRGWALQEGLLSRRVLRCGRDELSWTCLEGDCSESIPAEEDSRIRHQWQNVVKRALVTGIKNYGNLNAVDTDSIFGHWLSIVENYTCRRLSEPSDKLIAVEGVQRSIGLLIEEEPIVGIWKGRFFPPSLLWVVAMGDNGGSGASIQCPSWSWASVPYPVTYLKPSRELMVYLPEILSWDVRVDSKLNAINGFVTIRCELLREGKLKVKIGGAVQSALYYDKRDDFSERATSTDDWFMLVGVTRYAKPKNPKNEGYGYEKYTVLLRLKQLAPDEMDFQRIGVAKAHGEFWPGRGASKVIRLF